MQVFTIYENKVNKSYSFKIKAVKDCDIIKVGFLVVSTETTSQGCLILVAFKHVEGTTVWAGS